MQIRLVLLKIKRLGMSLREVNKRELIHIGEGLNKKRKGGTEVVKVFKYLFNILI